jgi:hypothetical protein
MDLWEKGCEGIWTKLAQGLANGGGGGGVGIGDFCP